MNEWQKITRARLKTWSTATTLLWVEVSSLFEAALADVERLQAERDVLDGLNQDSNRHIESMRKRAEKAEAERDEARVRIAELETAANTLAEEVNHNALLAEKAEERVKELEERVRFLFMHHLVCTHCGTPATPAADHPLCPVHKTPTVDSKGRPNACGLGACLSEPTPAAPPELPLGHPFIGQPGPNPKSGHCGQPESAHQPTEKCGCTAKYWCDRHGRDR